MKKYAVLEDSEVAHVIAGRVGEGRMGFTTCGLELWTGFVVVGRPDHIVGGKKTRLCKRCAKIMGIET